LKKNYKQAAITHVEDISFIQAGIIGIAQVFALIPGAKISRHYSRW